MSVDKSELAYHGKPQSRYCFELLSSICPKVYISNRREQESNPGHDELPQIPDHLEYIGRGPLTGILSAMKEYPSVAWLVLACDLPLVTIGTLKGLMINRDIYKLATAYRSVHDHLPEPLCAIYEPHGSDILRDFFRRGLYCPRKILMNSDVKLIDLDDLALENINTLSEYHFVKSKLIK